MAQISKGDTFANGEQVTGARLNQLVDSSVIIAGAITEQSAMTANTVASNDSVLLYDLSATALRKPTVGDLLNSNLPITASTITTSTINAVANSDILITPNDSINATGKTFSSPDGITVTVASTAHGLVTGQQVTITASVTAYSGIYRITVTSVDAFTYVLFPTTSSASGTCSYVREGTVRIAGELNTTGVLNISGSTLLAGNTRVSGALTSTGTANFANTVQYSGTPVYGISSFFEGGVSAVNCLGGTAAEILATCNLWLPIATLSSLTKTNKEVWEFTTEFSISWSGVPQGQNQCKFRVILVSTGAVLAEKYRLHGPLSQLCFHKDQVNMSAIIPESTVFTNDSIRVEIFYSNLYSAGQSAFLRAGPHGDQFETGTSNKTRLVKYIRP